ncbi:unnamed protein product [Boreogadus saida]
MRARLPTPAGRADSAWAGVHYLGVIEEFLWPSCTSPFMATANACQQRLHGVEPVLAAPWPLKGQHDGWVIMMPGGLEPGNPGTNAGTQMERAAEHG